MTSESNKKPEGNYSNSASDLGEPLEVNQSPDQPRTPGLDPDRLRTVADSVNEELEESRPEQTHQNPLQVDF